MIIFYLTGDAQDLRPLPAASSQTPDQRIQSLLETLATVITHKCICLVSLSNLSEYGGISDLGWWTT